MSTVAEKIETKAVGCTIRPYIAAGTENFGLEKYDMVVFEGVKQTEYLTCIEVNGVREYINGLNENARSVRDIPEGDKKTAKIKQIRKTVIFLEKALGSNTIDENDPKFWEKVKTVHPNNHDFWKEVHLVLSNGAIYLDPASPMDLIKISAIEAGGFGEIAKSYTDAKSKKNSPKYYLDRLEESAMTHTELKKMRNKALSRLEHLFHKETDRMFLLAKILDPNGHSVKLKTPHDVMYDNLDKYITAEGPETSKRKAAREFLDVESLQTHILTARAVVKDAIFYKLIFTRPDQMIYHQSSGTQLGRNVEETIETLLDPLHEKTYLELKKEVEKYW